MSPSLEWNDLHDLLCVVEAGSLSAAARQLGVSQSTMSRRIAALEARGLRVFDGNRTEMLLTSLGEELVAAARAMRQAFASAEAALGAAPPGIRMAACEMTARLFVADAVPDWTERSGQAVDLGVFEDLFVLKPADYDVMVLPLAELPSTMKGIQIGTLDLGLYASAACLSSHPVAPDRPDLAGVPVIRASGSLARTEPYRWLAAQGGTTALLASSPLAQLEACARGQGIALLPRRLADEDARLKRLEREVPPPVDVWIVADAANATHPRVASFLRWAASRFAKAAASPPARVASQPEHDDGRQGTSGEKHLGAAVVTRGDPPPVLQAGERVLDAMALAIGDGVVRDGDLTSLARGNAGLIPRSTRAQRNQSAS